MKSKFSKITREVRNIALGNECLDSKFCSVVDVVKAINQFEEAYFKPLYEIGVFLHRKGILTDDYDIDYYPDTNQIEIVWNHRYITSRSTCPSVLIGKDNKKVRVDCWNVTQKQNDDIKHYIGMLEDMFIDTLNYYERIAAMKKKQHNMKIESVNSNFSISIDSIRNYVRLYLDREGNYQEKCLTGLLPLIDFNDGDTVNTYDIEIYEEYREMCFNKTYVKVSDCPEYLRNEIMDIRNDYLIKRPFMKSKTLVSYWQNNNNRG